MDIFYLREILCSLVKNRYFFVKAASETDLCTGMNKLVGISCNQELTFFIFSSVDIEEVHFRFMETKTKLRLSIYLYLYLYTFYTLDYQQQELLVFEGECQLLSHGKHLLRKAVYELFGHFVSIVLFLRDPEKHNTYFNPGDYTVSILKIYILKPFTDSIYDII